MSEVVLVPTGVSNTASISTAFRRLGLSSRIAASAADVLKAERLVLPGVGAFGSAVEHLRRSGLFDAVRARWDDPRPAMAVCLGLQLLFEGSDEAPGVPGLGLVPGRISRLETLNGRTPYFGWSGVRGDCGDGDAYFAHSFGCPIGDAPRGWRLSAANHDRRGVVGVMSRHEGRHLACQFHPELSGEWGRELLGAWCEGRPSAPSTDAGGEKISRVIPCLDVRDGRVVKGVQFRSLRDAGDPATSAEAYERLGADEIVMLDVGATPEGRDVSLQTVRALRRVLSIPLTVGGGVRSEEDAAQLLEAGADKIAVNTAAVRDPSLLSRLASRFGAQCVVLAIDAAVAGDRAWRVRVRAGEVESHLDAVEWSRRGASLGAGEILLTSIDRDGTGLGYDLELVRAVARASGVPVIASGGGANAAHMAEAVNAGADAVLAASIFHDGVASVSDVKRALRRAGHRVRLVESGAAATSRSRKEFFSC